MEKIKVELGKRSYYIYIGKEILEEIGNKIKEKSFSPICAIISNPTIYNIYGEKIYKALKNKDFQVHVILIPDGEQYKNFFWAYHILSELLSIGLDRNSFLIALGGGVIGDITGFVASVYMRGISYIQVPTTLLAQVDSSVGGKTGVNHALGKNMIGTFYQPFFVWIDVTTLHTLPKREVLAGLAEVIKYGIIWDKNFFEFLIKTRKNIISLVPEVIVKVITRCCEIKAEVVCKDEREAGLRSILNYGHTIGHAIETITNYKKYLHGEAVAIGMVSEAMLASAIGMFNFEEVKKIKETINSYELPIKLDSKYDIFSMLKIISLDKKARAGKVRFILPETIGKVKIVKDISDEKIIDVLKFIMKK